MLSPSLMMSPIKEDKIWAMYLKDSKEHERESARLRAENAALRAKMDQMAQENVALVHKAEGLEGQTKIYLAQLADEEKRLAQSGLDFDAKECSELLKQSVHNQEQASEAQTRLDAVTCENVRLRRRVEELEDGVLRLKEEYTERVAKLEARVRQLVQLNTTTQAQLQDSLLASGSLAASQPGTRQKPAKPSKLGQSPALKAQQELSEQLAKQQQVIDALTEKVGELEQSAKLDAPAPEDDLVVDQEYIEKLKRELDEM